MIYFSTFSNPEAERTVVVLIYFLIDSFFATTVAANNKNMSAAFLWLDCSSVD